MDLERDILLSKQYWQPLRIQNLQSITKKLHAVYFWTSQKPLIQLVNHRILLSKINKYGVRGIAIPWLSDYLNNRQQYVKIGNFEWCKLQLTCGVRQGSTLGLLLFLLYILSFRIFADDTNIFYSDTNIHDVENVMNEELTNIQRYCATNKFSINFKKTNFMILSSRREVFQDIHIENVTQTDYIKYLGIYIDKYISWDQYINHVKNKIAKNTGIINKLRNYLDIKMLKPLYYALVYPYIYYGLISWGNTYTSKLENVRIGLNKCIRNIFFANRRESVTPHFNLLRVLKFDNIILLKTATFIYKIINGNDNLPSIYSELISLACTTHAYNTRFAVKQKFLYRPNVRTNQGKFKFVSSKILESIDYSIKQSKTANVFKKSHKNFLLLSQN